MTKVGVHVDDISALAEQRGGAGVAEQMRPKTDANPLPGATD